MILMRGQPFVLRRGGQGLASSGTLVQVNFFVTAKIVSHRRPLLCVTPRPHKQPTASSSWRRRRTTTTTAAATGRLRWKHSSTSSASSTSKKRLNNNKAARPQSRPESTTATVAPPPPPPSARYATKSSSSLAATTTRPQWPRYWMQRLEQILRRPRTIPIPRWMTPRHHTITFSEVLGHASFLLVAISYAVDDFLWLRILAVAGSSSMLFFAYFHPYGRILWLPFQWNVMFIGLNLYRIGKIHWDHFLAERLPQEWIDFRNRNFYLMDPSDFATLVHLGNVREYEPGEWIVEQGQGNAHVGLVLQGTAKVLVDGAVTYVLEEANFLHESGLHAGLLLPGSVETCCTVVAETHARVLTWDRSELVALMHRNGGVRRSLKAILSWDIVHKLKQQRLLLTRHQIDDPEEWTERRNRQTHYRYRAILQNMCEHPHYLQERRKQLAKYRMIHNIDDATHLQALREIGWTVDEFEAGYKEGARIDENEQRFWMRLYNPLFHSNRDFE